MAGNGGFQGFPSRMGDQGPQRICRYFQQDGTCPDGNTCRFLHELHGPDAPKVFFASHEDRVWSHPEVLLLSTPLSATCEAVAVLNICPER
jgi:hypothetical protein